MRCSLKRKREGRKKEERKKGRSVPLGLISFLKWGMSRGVSEFGKGWAAGCIRFPLQQAEQVGGVAAATKPGPGHSVSLDRFSGFS